MQRVLVGPALVFRAQDKDAPSEVLPHPFAALRSLARQAGAPPVTVAALLASPSENNLKEGRTHRDETRLPRGRRRNHGSQLLHRPDKRRAGSLCGTFFENHAPFH